MSTAALRRWVRRTMGGDRGLYGGSSLVAQVQDDRQGPRTGRREGSYRGSMAAMLRNAGHYRRQGSLRAARMLLAAHRDRRTALAA